MISALDGWDPARSGETLTPAFIPTDTVDDTVVSVVQRRGSTRIVGQITHHSVQCTDLLSPSESHSTAP